MLGAARTVRASQWVPLALAVRGMASSAAPQRVGFIGLGNMGGHMARNLQKAGHQLVVFDVNKETVDGFVKAGAKSAVSPKELAGQVDTVITMLPSSPHVREVYTGSNGLFHNLKAGSLLIDCSTIDPGTSRDMAKAAKERQFAAVDAPVSGGVGGAEKGTLTFMVGGSEPDFNRAKQLLQHMGASIFHCGDNGNGQVVKICNNMLLAIGMIGTAEAMNLGQRLGMEPTLLAKIINVSSGRCWSSDTYNPAPGVMPNVPASRGYTGGFGSALMAKDLGLAMQAAIDSKTSVPLGSLSQQIYNQLASSDLANKDFSVVFQWLNDNINKGQKK